MNRATERTLIRRAMGGDGNAIEALIRAHQDALFAFILRMSGRPHVAEDIVQEAFVRVLGNLDRFDTRFRFSTWLFTIAKRLYVNASQKQRPAYDTDAVNLQQGRAATPSGLTARAETMRNMRDLLEVALGELNERQREIILLFHQQNWPIAEIADHLGMPEGTIKSHLHRARKRMRRLISADETLHARAEEVWS
ncbi:MAG: sigma-70 family RNA polymerase sigma factor [Planctomycetota bacterium]|nr:sigma-70 family RNA polymerase sigma factor [Planctomycetota bacterium]